MASAGRKTHRAQHWKQLNEKRFTHLRGLGCTCVQPGAGRAGCWNAVQLAFCSNTATGASGHFEHADGRAASYCWAKQSCSGYIAVIKRRASARAEKQSPDFIRPIDRSCLAAGDEGIPVKFMADCNRGLDCG